MLTVAVEIERRLLRQVSLEPLRRVLPAEKNLLDPGLGGGMGRGAG